MKKKHFIIGIVLLLFLGILTSVKLYLKNRQAVPVFSDNQVCFGMTPAEVFSFLGAPDTVEHRICDTPDSMYAYRTTVMEKDAEVQCIHINDRKLWQVNIEWSLESAGAATELYQMIYDAVYAKYSEDKNLSVTTVTDTEATVSTLSVSNGATGTIYTIYAEDCAVRILCINDHV